MKKQFALKSAKALNSLKTLAAKHESTTTLNFSMLVPCCSAGPVVDYSAPVLSH